MVGRRVAELEQVTCASPDYLKRHGTPKKLADLDGHRAVDYISTMTGKPYPLEFATADGMKLVNLPSQVSVTGTDVYAGAAVAGLGLVQVPRYRIAEQLAAGTLRVVLAAFPPPPLPVSVLYPQSRQLSSRVRVFADWLKDQFALQRI
jgi:DNA-binding transcriptional LysR family regulator